MTTNGISLTVLKSLSAVFVFEELDNMGMKVETRRKYEELAMDGQALLSGCVKECELDEKKLIKWKNSWDSLDRVLRALEGPAPNGKEIVNTLNSTMNVARRLAGQDVLEDHVEIKEDDPGDILSEVELNEADDREDDTLTIKQQITKYINRSGRSLMKAYVIATTANTLAGNLQIFQEIQKSAQEILNLPREVSKLRITEDESRKGRQNQIKPN